MIASKVLVDNYYRGRDIVLQLSSERREDDIKFLATRWLGESSHVLASLDENSLREIAQKVTLRKYNPNELIYQQEEWIENFHVILRGSVSLLIDPFFRVKQLASQAAAANVDSLLKDSAGNKSAAKMSNATYNPKAKQNRVCYGKQVGKLRAGESFGQEALLQKEELLPFTVFADEHVELLTISMEVFDKILLHHFQTIFLKQAQFLSQVEMFSKWSPHLLRQISIASKEKHYQLGECLFRQDMPVHCLYIIKSGSVKLSVSSIINPKCHKDVVDQIEPEKNYLAEMFAQDEEQELKKMMKKSASMHALTTLSTASIMIPHSISQISTRGSFSRSSFSGPINTAHLTNAALLANQRRRRSSTSAPLSVKVEEPVYSMFGFKLHEPTPKNSSEMCDLGVGDILCDIEALCGLKRQLFNAVCSSDLEVYVLDLYYFEQLLHKKAPQTIYQMLTRASQRVESWKERYVSQCGEFFNPLLTVLGQLEEKLSSNGYNKGVAKKFAYSPQEIAHVAIEKLGKVVANDRKGDSIEQDGQGLNEDADTIEDENSQTENCRQDEASAKMYRLDPEAIFSTPRPNSTNYGLRIHTRPLSSTNCITPSTKRTFLRFNSLPPRKVHDYEDTSQNVYPIPPPSPYPVQQEKTDDATNSLTVSSVDDWDSDDSDSMACSPRASANLAKIRSELLEKIKSESDKSLRPTISMLMWGTEQESRMGRDFANSSSRTQAIVVPTALQIDSMTSMESEVFEKDELPLIDLCDSKHSIESRDLEQLTTNERPSSVSIGNYKQQHQDDHNITHEGIRPTETLNTHNNIYNPPPTPRSPSLLFDHNDTTIPDDYKGLMENRPSSQKSFFSMTTSSGFSKQTLTKRPSTAPSSSVSGSGGKTGSSQVVRMLEMQKPRSRKITTMPAVLTIYTLSSQHSGIPCRHKSVSIPSNHHHHQKAKPRVQSPAKKQTSTTMQHGKHISLSTMEKEGNLYLARPWTGHRSRPPSAPVGRPTERRKLPPRPPVNLTPHLQRPYYL